MLSTLKSSIFKQKLFILSKNLHEQLYKQDLNEPNNNKNEMVIV